MSNLPFIFKISLLLLLFSVSVHSDTIEHYMNIANNIPQMEMKADQQSQAWARSARNILSLTSECIAESLVLANETARNQGTPLFCLPAGETLDAGKVNVLIQQTYQEISSQPSEKNKMTVSQVAFIGLKKRFPCQNDKTLPQNVTPPVNHSNAYQQANPMQHQSSLGLLG